MQERGDVSGRTDTVVVTGYDRVLGGGGEIKVVRVKGTT